MKKISMTPEVHSRCEIFTFMVLLIAGSLKNKTKQTLISFSFDLALPF